MRERSDLEKSPTRRHLPFMASSLPILFLLLISITSRAAGEIRYSEIRSDDRPIIPFDEFRFTHHGQLEVNLTQISISGPNPSILELSQLGFFLGTRDSWINVLQQIEDDHITCALQSESIKKVFVFSQLPNPNTTTFNLLYAVPNADQYTLAYANCLPQVKVSMNVRSVMYNLESGKSNRRDYLSAETTLLPGVYFAFFLVYFGLTAVWIYVLYRKRLTVFRIHFFMLWVVIFSALYLLCEAEYKSYIMRTGSAHGWDVLFYISSFLKDITLFTLIVLIGSGWSILKPYLQDREKMVLMIVIPLQVVGNIAQVAIDESGLYGRYWITWNQVFLLVDVVCCCAVLFPIVWSIKKLRKAARTEGKAAVDLMMKLTLFRQYCIAVICYICFTRVVAYPVETMTSYKYLWTCKVAEELATLAFYVFTGYKFKPEAEQHEEEAAAEQLKLEYEF